MKTKKLFLMAAVLLSSVSAFAQSGNNEPLKGDVNEDGTVDVADITAVIKIMRDGGGTAEQPGGGTAEQPKYYWYVGHVTLEQFEDPTLLTTIINNGTSTTSATGPSTLTMPTTGDGLVYIYPTVWGTPNIVDSTGYGTGDGNYLEDAGLTPPSGYDIRYWDGDSSVRGKTLSITWSK